MQIPHQTGVGSLQRAWCNDSESGITGCDAAEVGYLCQKRQSVTLTAVPELLALSSFCKQATCAACQEAYQEQSQHPKAACQPAGQPVGQEISRSIRMTKRQGCLATPLAVVNLAQCCERITCCRRAAGAFGGVALDGWLCLWRYVEVAAV